MTSTTTDKGAHRNGRSRPYEIVHNLKPQEEEMRCKLILSIILVGMAVIFTIQNVAAVDLTFLFWTLSMSRVLLMFLILSIGVTLGWMSHVGKKRIKTPNAKQAL